MNNNLTRSDFLVAYGKCDPVQHALKMVEYYESYGLDLDDVRADPFLYHSGEQYELRLLVNSSHYRVVMASIFDFTSYENRPLHSAWWSLRVKVDVNGPKGLILQESLLWFGVWR